MRNLIIHQRNILARSMLRLLWDRINSKPVLFLDRIYPAACYLEREEAIQSVAKACAKEMGLHLYVCNEDESYTGGCIESLGSSCPYEYSDASQHPVTQGVFNIRNLVRLL